MNALFAQQHVAQLHQLPNFVLLGQGKAGTSLIFRHLQAHAQVTVSSRKELHFFSNNYHKGLGWYKSHFPEVTCTPVVAEISPSYLCPRAIRRIAGTLGRDIRVAFVLRRPIEHCYSRYIQNLCARQNQASLPEKMDAMPARLKNMMQAIALCYQTFGADRVLPLFFETDIAAPDAPFAQKLAAFLDIAAPQTQNSFPTINRGVMPWLAYVPTDTTLWQKDVRYKIPRDHLIFCAQPRNSKIVPAPSDALLARARHAQSTWVRSLSEETYAEQQMAVVEPASYHLEKAFGFDMAHWRNAPYTIRYAPAPLPDALRTPKE